MDTRREAGAMDRRVHRREGSVKFRVRHFQPIRCQPFGTIEFAPEANQGRVTFRAHRLDEEVDGRAR